MEPNRTGVVLPLTLSVTLFAAGLSVVLISVGAGEERRQSPTIVTAGEIAANPDKYYGKKVTVRAEVEDVLSRQVFLLDEDRLYAWPDVMVIAPALNTALPEDKIVAVTGTVRAFVDADLQRDYDWDWWDDLDTDIELTFRNRPVILADSVKTDSGTELVRR